MGGVCGSCGKELEPTVVLCGCNQEVNKIYMRKQRIKHLKVWVKERHKGRARDLIRIAEMEAEIESLENQDGMAQMEGPKRAKESA